jgi:hypothetical protein
LPTDRPPHEGRDLEVERPAEAFALLPEAKTRAAAMVEDDRFTVFRRYAPYAVSGCRLDRRRSHRPFVDP